MVTTGVFFIIIILLLLLLCLFLGGPDKGNYMWVECKPDSKNANCVEKKGPLIDTTGSPQRLPSSVVKDMWVVSFLMLVFFSGNKSKGCYVMYGYVLLSVGSCVIVSHKKCWFYPEIKQPTFSCITHIMTHHICLRRAFTNKEILYTTL